MTWRSTRFQAGVVDLGHRPPHRAGPQDGARVRARQEAEARAATELPGALPRLPGSALCRRPPRARHRAAPRAGRARLRSLLPDAGARAEPPGAAPDLLGLSQRPSPTTEIPHEPGEELQLDWWELHETPWGEKAYVLVGALSHSGRVRGVFSEGQSFPHLVAALDGVLRRLGGTAKAWRTDRMATVVDPETGRLRPQFARGRQALRHEGRHLPRLSPAAKGRGRVGDRLPGPLLVALGAGVDGRPGPGRPRPLLRHRRRRAAPEGRHGRLPRRRRAAARRCRRSPFPAELEVERMVEHQGPGQLRGQPLQRPAGAARPGGDGQGPARRARGGDRLGRRAQGGAPPPRARPAPRRRSADAEHAQALERAVLDSFTSSPPCNAQGQPPAGRGGAGRRGADPRC